MLFLHKYSIKMSSSKNFSDSFFFCAAFGFIMIHQPCVFTSICGWDPILKRVSKAPRTFFQTLIGKKTTRWTSVPYIFRLGICGTHGPRRKKRLDLSTKKRRFFVLGMIINLRLDLDARYAVVKVDGATPKRWLSKGP